MPSVRSVVNNYIQSEKVRGLQQQVVLLRALAIISNRKKSEACNRLLPFLPSSAIISNRKKSEACNFKM